MSGEQVARQRDLVDTIERARTQVMSAMSLMTGYVGEDGSEEESLDEAYDILGGANGILWHLANELRDCERGTNGRALTERDARIGVTAYERFSNEDQHFVPLSDDPSIHVLYRVSADGASTREDG